MAELKAPAALQRLVDAVTAKFSALNEQIAAEKARADAAEAALVQQDLDHATAIDSLTNQVEG